MLHGRKKMKLKIMALTTSLTLSAMPMSAPAQAGALATSVLDISNFTIFQGGTQLDGSDFTGLVVSNTADISSKLGATVNDDGVSGVGEDIDLFPVCVGNCPAVGNNLYPVITNPPGSTFATADQLQFGSPISGIVINGVPLASTATTSHGAYVSLDSPEDGTSTANNGLDTRFEFVLGSSGALNFSFDARAYLEAFTNSTTVFPTASSSAYHLTFTIDDLVGGANVVTWSPDGANNFGGASAFGLTAETDPFNLNDSVSRNSPFNGTSFRGAAEGVAFNNTWTGTTVALLANHPYQLTIRSGAEVDARLVEAVPEPATLALVGLGILGLGLVRRRRA
jgi:hypothetical protein